MRTLVCLSSSVAALTMVSMVMIGCGGGAPEPTTMTSATQDNLHVAIARDGTTLLDGKKVDATALTTRTHEAIAAHPNAKIIIDAEREVSFQVVMTAIDRMKQGGATSNQFVLGTILAASSVGGPDPVTAQRPNAVTSPGPVKGPTPEPHASVPLGTRWDCAFPIAKGTAQRQEANVLLQVHVESDGKPLSVDVLDDPGSGFGDAAKKCALEKAYQAARDVNGQPVRATTFPFYIQFVTH